MRTAELAALTVAVVVLGFFVDGATKQVRAHDPYGHWTQPGTGKSCCSQQRTQADGTIVGDCRRVRSYLGDDGVHYILVRNRWRPVPPDRVLRIPSPDGNSHGCVNDETLEIHCFVPGPPRS